MVPMDERETILNYDPMTQMWHAWTNIPAHIRKLDKAGWSRSKTRKYMDNGEEVAVDFTTPKHAITFRDLVKAQEAKERAAGRCFQSQEPEYE